MVSLDKKGVIDVIFVMIGILLEQENQQWNEEMEPSVALLLEGMLNSNSKQHHVLPPLSRYESMAEGIRGKRSEMEPADDHLTGDPEERFKKYNRARVLLGKRNF